MRVVFSHVFSFTSIILAVAQALVFSTSTQFQLWQLISLCILTLGSIGAMMYLSGTSMMSEELIKEQSKYRQNSISQIDQKISSHNNQIRTLNHTKQSLLQGQNLKIQNSENYDRDKYFLETINIDIEKEYSLIEQLENKREKLVYGEKNINLPKGFNHRAISIELCVASLILIVILSFSILTGNNNISLLQYALIILYGFVFGLTGLPNL